MGRATICVPKTDNAAEIFCEGLSDHVALSYGRLFAAALSDEDGFVTVTLTSGSVRVIGLDTARGELRIGRLHPNYRNRFEQIIGPEPKVPMVLSDEPISPMDR